MASPFGFSVSKPRNYIGEGLQPPPSELNPPILSGIEMENTERKINANLLHPGYLQPISRSISPDGRISPALIHQGRFLSPVALTETTPVSSRRGVSIRIAFRRFCSTQWRKHKALVLVFAAQLFAALMNLSARLLELGEVDSKLHPMQLLFFRMLVTTIGSSIYIISRSIPYGLLGPPKVRWLLVTRGLSGFLGIYGMWYSIEYMPLAEATVITFLAPILTGYWCHLFLKEPYTRTELLASMLALAGVVLIMKPASLISASSPEGGADTSIPAIIANATIAVTQGLATTAATDNPAITTSERLGAVLVALLGVLGGSVAFTTLRAIGQKAHALVSVNYFGVACLTVTLSVLTLAPYFDIGQPELRLVYPSSPRQLGLVAFIAVCGLVTQILTTKGLAAERSNRATVMVYTNMVFATGFDRFVWGTTMSWLSATGCAMIIMGAIWVALGKTEATKGMGNGDEERGAAVGAQGEEDGLLDREFEDRDEEDLVMETIR
ncbi:hypothetical protein GGR50DRAFT_358140 [Xylaria sp. CBS 124048]|nr:hypothetical protein GGR50DRAFT_358140 [Xylaria sp. CBS 124048]